MNCLGQIDLIINKMEITLDIEEKITVTIMKDGKPMKKFTTDGEEILFMVDDLEGRMNDAMADDWNYVLEMQEQNGKIQVSEREVFYAKREENAFTDFYGNKLRKNSIIGTDTDSLTNYRIKDYFLDNYHDFISMIIVVDGLNDGLEFLVKGLEALKKYKRIKY